MSDELVLTPLSTEASELLRWCVYGGSHPQDDGWLLLFLFANGLQASVVYSQRSNGISVGVMDGDALVQVWDWLEGTEAVARLVEVMKMDHWECPNGGKECSDDD